MAAKKTTVKQLEKLIAKADKVIIEWIKYKEDLVVAASSTPPGPTPPPPKH